MAFLPSWEAELHIHISYSISLYHLWRRTLILGHHCLNLCPVAFSIRALRSLIWSSILFIYHAWHHPCCRSSSSRLGGGRTPIGHSMHSPEPLLPPMSGLTQQMLRHNRIFSSVNLPLIRPKTSKASLPRGDWSLILINPRTWGWLLGFLFQSHALHSFGNLITACRISTDIPTIYLGKTPTAFFIMSHTFHGHSDNKNRPPLYKHFDRWEALSGLSLPHQRIHSLGGCLGN